MSQARSRQLFAGCLLGGAAGDALGAAVEFNNLSTIRKRFGPAGITEYVKVYGRVGAVTDNTQMTLFTAEGMIRSIAATQRALVTDTPTLIYMAYLRWLHTQGSSSPHPRFEDAIEGWLVRCPELHSRRAPDNTCLSALSLAQPGSVEHAINDSKGCGGVMRVAPVGLGSSNPFRLGCQVCALTHGHALGFLTGGYFAAMIASLLAGASRLEAAQNALGDFRTQLGEGLTQLLQRAIDLGTGPTPTPEQLQSLGTGRAAEQALAIALCCTLAADDFSHGIRLAVNHSGDSDSTGSITGNLLGATWGIEAVDPSWLDPLELADEISELAHDLADAVGGAAPDPTRYPPR